jgi:acetoin utilization deacetylase AcuC-like enzyme
MASRDRMVFDFAAEFGIPIAAAMAGGYGRDIATTVDVHLGTVRAAFSAWARRQPASALAEAVRHA